MDTMSAVDPRPNRIFDSALLDKVNRTIQKKIIEGRMTKDEAWAEFRRDLSRRMEKNAQ